ncbi:MAG TPA: histidine kinase dimerization/phosphoacceptor domain -containing protein [Spirochaetia bacterium]|nr:histidine kinase dimerization/phosphoacceptor domain -containing protein [Spirochaetia bacterium]
MERARRSPSLFSIFAAALSAATLLPLVATLSLWSFVYEGNATRSLGLAQISGALDGMAAFLESSFPTVDLEEDREALAKARRLLNGPIASIRVGPSEPAAAAAALSAFLGTDELRCEAEEMTERGGRKVGKRNGDGTWTLSDQGWVARAAAAWDGATEEGRRRLANGRVFVRAERDISKAVLRVGREGYVWAITAALAPDLPCYEFFHPQIESVDVSGLFNESGERVGAEIAGLRGLLGTARASETIRYDYAWKNPGDVRERRKIVLLRYLERQRIVACAGLYEDEYFLPARTAQRLFIAMVLAIGCITLGLSLGIILRINRSLRDLTRFSASAGAAGPSGSGAIEPFRSGIRELDVLSRTMVDMEGQILSRQRAMERELGEKNALLREVHHRVKNNLAVLASMVSLQTSRTDSPEARAALERVEGRVSSMAIAYQQLVESDEFASIPFDEYLRSLLTYYQSSGGPGRAPVARSEFLEPCRIGLEAAVPLGLAAQELISNAYAHGAPAGGGAAVAVRLAKDGRRAVLEVADNGGGLAEGYEERTGLLLVRALAEQMGAEFSLESPAAPLGGTRASFAFGVE